MTEGGTLLQSGWMASEAEEALNIEEIVSSSTKSSSNSLLVALK